MRPAEGLGILEEQMSGGEAGGGGSGAARCNGC